MGAQNCAPIFAYYTFCMNSSNISTLISKLESKNRKEADQAAAELAALGGAAVRPLVAALQQPSMRTRASGALVSIGAPAIEWLTNLMRLEPCGSATWNAADQALCRIIEAPTRKELAKARNEIYVYWIGAAIAGLIFVGIGLWAELGWAASLIMGLIVAYLIWAVVVSGWRLDSWEESLLAVVTAPFHFAGTVSEYKKMLATREQLKQKHQLPA